MTYRHIGALSAGLIALTLGACATPVPTAGIETAPPPAGAAAEAEAAPPSSSTARIARIGEAITYADGLKVSVVTAKRFRISQTAAGGKPGGPGVILTVTITNGAAIPYDAALTGVSVASGEQGDQAEAVFDVDAGLTGGFTGQVQPGRKQTARFGFAVPAGPTDLQIEVRPGLADHEAALFAGKA